MIALIAAVPFETNRLRRGLRQQMEPNCPFAVFQGQLGGNRVILTHAGVGKANAAAAAALLLAQVSPDLIISFGCGGSYPDTGLRVGDLAVASESIYGDEGVLVPQGFLDMQALGLPLVNREKESAFNRFPANRTMVEALRPALTSAVAPRRAVFGPIVTVSTCSGTLDAGRTLVRRTQGIAENMEGAAVAHLCTLFDVPFLEFRGISNLVEDRDLSRWDLTAGSETAQQAVMAALEFYPFPMVDR